MIAAELPITRRLRPSQGWSTRTLSEMWAYRELLYFFIWRDIKVRYKQTLLGAGWAIVQPVMTMVVFTIFFGHLAKVPSDGLPYPVFSMIALVPWSYFASALSGFQYLAQRLSAHHLEGVLSAADHPARRGDRAAGRLRDRIRAS